VAAGPKATQKPHQLRDRPLIVVHLATPEVACHAGRSAGSTPARSAS
jgi:hypothetical protein